MANLGIEQLGDRLMLAADGFEALTQEDDLESIKDGMSNTIMVGEMYTHDDEDLGLTTETETQEVGLLLPAVQKVRDAAPTIDPADQV